ncbi:terpene synthase family protein [Streptomyces sp. NPDC101150]|uniref:terpene synthase family protein n=1 Tax=Streptomyces sp. NPDC101150 TaxID=3366114 RepID=UPI00381B6434
MMQLAPGAPGPYGMQYPDLPDEPETLINPHYPAIVRAVEEVIATCTELEATERHLLEQDDLGMFLSSSWPLASQDEVCARIPLLLLSVARDDRLDRGNTREAAALDRATLNALQHLLAALPADSAQRITEAAAAEGGLVRRPVEDFTSIEAYLEYRRGSDGQRVLVELTAASPGRSYGPLLDTPEAQEFLRLNTDLGRLANDIVGAPREMSQKGDRINAVTLHQRLTGCTTQQALDACLKFYYDTHQRYDCVRHDLSHKKEFRQMREDLHLLYSGAVFFMKRSPRYRRFWVKAGATN